LSRGEAIFQRSLILIDRGVFFHYR
jgi:hypothetical protein